MTDNADRVARIAELELLGEDRSEDEEIELARLATEEANYPTLADSAAPTTCPACSCGGLRDDFESSDENVRWWCDNCGVMISTDGSYSTVNCVVCQAWINPQEGVHPGNDAPGICHRCENPELYEDEEDLQHNDGSTE